MMKWNVGMKIGSGFALALAILVIISTVAYQSISKLIDTAGWVDHTRQVLVTLENVISTMKDAETGQRGYLLTGEDPYLEPYRPAQAAAAQQIKTLRELTKDNPGQQRRLDVLELQINGKDGKFVRLQEGLEARRDRGLDAAVQVMQTDKGKEIMDNIRRTITEMETTEEALLATRAAEAQASARRATFAIVGGTLAAIGVLTLVGFLITRDIAHPLREITATAERIAAGDLSVVTSASDRTDEVGVLDRTFSRMTGSLKTMADVAGKIAAGDLRAKIAPQSEKDVLGNAFALMVENLQRLMADLTEGVNVLGSSANEISVSTTQLAASASESAAAVSETTTTVEEVRQTAQVANQKAKNVADTAQKAAQVSLSGRKSIEDVSGGMNRIRQQMEAIAASMGRLSEQSQAIGQIIATVEDLAAQSNLLAVNAAIEAAKAGEHGKGFGVVAQEVKSLAEQSRQATSQVRTILSDVQKATATAVLATEQGSKAVEAGARQTELSGEAIQALAGSVSEAVQAATQIAASSQQQLVGVDQVATAMENIKQASTQNVASAKQLETAARNLSELGQRLKQLVAKYKV
ncbi:MAG: methyl-accepting chemotaxis sensory transducer [Lacunisphaera sp.]|nr:methyl-accepting chemotaxis sensory transducer [Lacunisphaera sp.]